MYESSEDELGSTYRRVWNKQLATTKIKGTQWAAQKYSEYLMVEFKTRVKEFINDRNKSIEDIKLLITWSGKDEKLPAGWKISRMAKEEQIYQGVQYKLIDKVQRSTWVMFIEDFLEKNQ